MSAFIPTQWLLVDMGLVLGAGGQPRLEAIGRIDRPDFQDDVYMAERFGTRTAPAQRRRFDNLDDAKDWLQGKR